MQPRWAATAARSSRLRPPPPRPQQKRPARRRRLPAGRPAPPLAAGAAALQAGVALTAEHWQAAWRAARWRNPCEESWTSRQHLGWRTGGSSGGGGSGSARPVRSPAADRTNLLKRIARPRASSRHEERGGVAAHADAARSASQRHCQGGCGWHVVRVREPSKPGPAEL